MQHLRVTRFVQWGGAPSRERTDPAEKSLVHRTWISHIVVILLLSFVDILRLWRLCNYLPYYACLHISILDQFVLNKFGLWIASLDGGNISHLHQPFDVVESWYFVGLQMLKTNELIHMVPPLTSACCVDWRRGVGVERIRKQPGCWHRKETLTVHAVTATWYLGGFPLAMTFTVCELKMACQNNEFCHETWWFSILMLNYRRVYTVIGPHKNWDHVLGWTKTT